MHIDLFSMSSKNWPFDKCVLVVVFKELIFQARKEGERSEISNFSGN